MGSKRKVLLREYGALRVFTLESNLAAYIELEDACAFSQSVQLFSRVQFIATPWTSARQASLSITNSWSLLKLTSIASVMPSNHLILVSPSPPTLNLSQYRGLFQRIDSPHNKGTLDYNSGVCKPHIHGDLVDLSEGLLTRGREDGLDCVRAIIWAGPHGTVTERSWSRSGRAETLKSWRRLS